MYFYRIRYRISKEQYFLFLTLDFYFKFAKFNIDKLKLIQIDINLKNEKVKTLLTSTYQFNLKFDNIGK